MNSLEFRNRVGIPLEEIGQKELGNRYFSADKIMDGGKFVDAMLDVLKVVFDSPSDYAGFTEDCSSSVGKRPEEIGFEKAETLFKAFRQLYRERCNGK